MTRRPSPAERRTAAMDKTRRWLGYRNLAGDWGFANPLARRRAEAEHRAAYWAWLARRTDRPRDPVNGRDGFGLVDHFPGAAEIGRAMNIAAAKAAFRIARTMPRRHLP